MQSREKTFTWKMAIIIISALAVILLSQPLGLKYADETADMIYPHEAVDPMGRRADNAGPLNITSIPMKAKGDFVIEVGISESAGMDVSELVVWSSTDLITWKELPVEKYRPAVNDTIVVQASQLLEGTVYLGVSRSDALGPDDYGTVEIAAPKDITVSETKEIFEPGLIMYIIIIAAIVVFGGGALLYKGGTDQIKGMMRQIHKEERSKRREEDSRGRGNHGNGDFGASRHHESKSNSEISWGGSNDDDTAGWEEEPDENDISWGKVGDERPRSRRRGREEAGEDDIAWGGSGDERPRDRSKGRKDGKRKNRRRESDEDEIAWGSNYGSGNREERRYGRDTGGWEDEDRYGSRGEREGRSEKDRQSERRNESKREYNKRSERKEKRGDHIGKTRSGRKGELPGHRDRSGRGRERERKPRSTYGKRNKRSSGEYRHGSRRYGRKDDDMSWLN